MYPNQPYGNQYPGSAPPFGSGQYQGQPPYGAGQYPGQAPFGAGQYPGQQPPFGAGYPTQMPQPYQGMPQPGQPMGMPQPGQPPQPFNYQSPPANPVYPAPPMNYTPPQQPTSYPSYPQGQPGQPGQPLYPQIPGMGSAPEMPVYAQTQQQSYNQPAYHQPTQMQQQHTGRPTVVPSPTFDACNDAGALRKAMKGFGTDEDGLINVLCRRSCAQRMEIVRAFKTAYGKDLIDDIKSESSGNFQRTLISLLYPTSELYARELFEAMYGGGTDEDVLIEVMCTMSNREIREIGMYFQRLYGKNLEAELRSDTSGSFKRLMTSLSTGNRDESMMTDVNQAKMDAQVLKAAGIDKWGTDESAFNRILCLRNYEQIKLIAREYQSLTGNTLEKDIKREFSGDIEDGLLAILRVAENRPEFFARRLHKSMAGLGTNDNSLIRLIVSRSEIDMEDVKEAFMRKYGKTLKSFIKGDTSGHYKHALYALCGENRS